MTEEFTRLTQIHPGEVIEFRLVDGTQTVPSKITDRIVADAEDTILLFLSGSKFIYVEDIGGSLAAITQTEKIPVKVVIRRPDAVIGNQTRLSL